MLQLLWKIPGSKSDQARIDVSRTYKAPTARELIPRRWVETDNSATSPNFQGNPDLRPELAWGLDLGYEHYMRDGGFLGLNGYVRRIDNVVLESLFKDVGGWVTSPINGGRARAAGVELEAKGRLSRPVAMAPVYGAWRLSDSVLMRLTLTNLVARNDVNRTSYSDAVLIQHQSVSSRTTRGLRLLLEANL